MKNLTFATVVVLILEFAVCWSPAQAQNHVILYNIDEELELIQHFNESYENYLKLSEFLSGKISIGSFKSETERQKLIEISEQIGRNNEEMPQKIVVAKKLMFQFKELKLKQKGKKGRTLAGWNRRFLKRNHDTLARITQNYAAIRSSLIHICLANKFLFEQVEF